MKDWFKLALVAVCLLVMAIGILLAVAEDVLRLAAYIKYLST